jgi:hypothetical protein
MDETNEVLVWPNEAMTVRKFGAIKIVGAEITTCLVLLRYRYSRCWTPAIPRGVAVQQWLM